MITLPLRLTVRAASLLLRGGEELATRTLGFALKAAGVRWKESGRGFSRPVDWEAQPDQPVTVADREPQPPPAPPAPLTPDVIEVEEEAEEEEPAHVSEEPALTADLAEPGAEHGAGAEVRVQEPWPGYRQLNARDVVARVRSASAAELAGIQLYESSNQTRPTVLSAVERQLKLTSGRGNPMRKE